MLSGCCLKDSSSNGGVYFISDTPVEVCGSEFCASYNSSSPFSFSNMEIFKAPKADALFILL